MRDPIRCLNRECPDPGAHAHDVDSRDDMEVARSSGYYPIARCGSARPHRTHRTADRPGYCVGNIGVIVGRPA